MKFSVLFIMTSCGPNYVCEEPQNNVPRCVGSCENYRTNSVNITDYDVNMDVVSEEGIYVDRSDIEVDLGELDRLTREVEECLGKTINYWCLAVKIAPDSYVSECTGTELFPCDFPENRCDKIRPPGEDCPCNCTGVTQDGNIIVVTPNLGAYKHELIHIVAGLTDYELANRPDISACE